MSEVTVPDRPLVTFALFAYNQQDFIREAVESAFSQTYEPLEIILSDDASTDETFEIMQEMAAAYRGPHDVQVRRNEVNYGTALHVQVVAEKSTGQFLVVAAGDDISESHRCERIAEQLASSTSKISCVHSGATFFEDAGGAPARTRPPKEKSMISPAARRDFLLRDRLPFFSPTCAYSRENFESFKPIIGGSIIEDGVMAFRSLTSGATLAIEEPLVRIRKQVETAGTGNKVTDVGRWNRFVMSRIISYCNNLRDVETSGVDGATAVRLEELYHRKIRRLSMFMVHPSRVQSLSWRLLFSLRYFIFYPSSAALPNRVANALRVTGFSDSVLYRVAKPWFRKTS